MKNTRSIPLLPFLVALCVGAGSYMAWTVEDATGAGGETAVAANGLLHTGVYGSAIGSYDLGAHQTLSRVILLIRENYVDPERVKPYDMFLAALDYIEKTVPEVIVETSSVPDFVTVSVGDARRQFEVHGLDQLWEVTMALRDIFRFMQGHLTTSTKPRDIEYAAINGMLSTLDPHSILLKPESFDEVKLSTKGEFGGLGIVISIRDGRLTIMSPIEGTPATRAGLKAKDVIARIGEESTVNMSLEEAVNRLRGKPGSQVDIWILRKSWTEPRKFQLTRDIIKIESVTSELLADGIGYIRIKSFQGNTFGDLHSHLEKLRVKLGTQLKGLVLDFRNNPGGLLDQAILISDRFIDKGALVITVGEGNRKRDVKSAHLAGTETDYPIAVLVNAGSASASEIVAGALKNHDRATLIGQPTFGKGSVQVLYDFKDRSALKLTIAQYLTPGDISIQSVGIRPDIELVPGTIGEDGIHLFVNDLSPREKDLKKHLNRFEEKKQSTSTSKYRVVHLIEPEPEDEDRAAKAVTDGFREDFEIQFAQSLLANSKGIRRSSILRDGRKEIQVAVAEQSKKIAERFKTLGIDWRDGPASSDGRVVVSLELVQKKSAVKAGDKITFKATAKNLGTSPLYRVYGTTQSENPFFKNLEFVFGYLAPEKAVSWNVDVKLPKGMSSRLDGVTLTLGDEHEVLKDIVATTLVNIQEEAKPRFVVSYQIDDTENGNGDGLLQVGEDVGLRFQVSNLGKGSAGEVMLTAKNITGPELFLDVGRSRLGVIKSGDSKQGMLKFALRDKVDKVKLRVAVWDTELGASFSNEIEFPVLSPVAGAKKNKSLRMRSGTKVPIFAGASGESQVIAYAKPGVVMRSDLAFVSGWRRVRLGKLILDAPDKRAKKKSPQKWIHGFVRESDLVVMKKNRKGTRKAFTMVSGQAAPFVELGEVDLHVNGESVHLTGIVGDELGLKDLYIFVNDSKVHYQPLSASPNENGTLSESLDVHLPVKVGSNTITIVVRENENLFYRKSLGFYRDEMNIAANRAKTPKGAIH